MSDQRPPFHIHRDPGDETSLTHLTKVVHHLPWSDELRADSDPEYAASEEYLSRHPAPPRPSWRDRLRWRLPTAIAWPFWWLGGLLNALGYLVANGTSAALRSGSLYEPGRPCPDCGSWIEP